MRIGQDGELRGDGERCEKNIFVFLLVWSRVHRGWEGGERMMCAYPGTFRIEAEW